MKAQIVSALLISIAGLSSASASPDFEPAGAPAIRLVRAALPAFAASPAIFKAQVLEWNEKATAQEIAEEAKTQSAELGRMLDEVKAERANPIHGVNTTISTSFADGSFGIEIKTSNLRDIETTGKTVVCKALSKSGSKTAYECKVTFFWDGEFGSLQAYELTFVRDSKTGAIVPRKLTRIMAG